MDVVYELCADLLEKLSECANNEEKEKIIHNYIDQILSKVRPVCDFRSGLEWFNVTSPLSLQKELGLKVVLLDFFTYCCINCLHVLPELKTLEHKHPVENGLVVVGVHSAKFDAEKSGENVRSAVLRHEITHPVVNDVGAVMWSQLDIACWPTLLLLGPGGYPLFVLMGEGHSSILDLLTRSTLAYFSKKDKLSLSELPQISPSNHLAPASVLSFPGRVAIFNDKLAISDSGHHRILIVDIVSGIVEKTIGHGESGLNDGSFKEAKFHSPQGIVWLNENLIFVADTENHTIREVDLLSERVKTMAGTGEMGTDREGGRTPATSQPISSPWGLSLDPTKRLLIIAMAGTHQIWGFALQQVKWWKNRVLEAGSCVALAGSGREENRNSAYPMAAGFAQPSGLALAGQSLLVADSESSSIRAVLIDNGKVSAVAGGEKDPLNLFAFGDADGRGTQAKLQHPLDIAWSEGRKLAFLADTFNNKIKSLQLDSGECRTLSLQGTTLSEPGGVCVDEMRCRLVIADTNNHTVKLVDVQNNFAVTQLDLKFDVELNGTTEGMQHQVRLQVGPGGGATTLKVEVQLTDGKKPTEDAPQTWKLKLPDSWPSKILRGKLTKSTSGNLETNIEIVVPDNVAACHLDLNISVVSCDDDKGQCRMDTLKATVIVEPATKHQDNLSIKMSL